jgi:dGTPase
MNEVRGRVAALGATSLDQVRRAPARLVSLSSEIELERATAKAFLCANFYDSPGMEEAHRHADRVVEELFARLMADPGLLPADHQTQISTEGLARTVADYIAGMTDSYIEQFWQHVTRS